MSSAISEIARSYAQWYEGEYLDYLVQEEIMSRAEAEREWSDPLSLTPVTDEDIAAVERDAGVLPAAYVAFMRELGAGHILAATEEEGPMIFDVPAPADAIDRAATHANLRAEFLAEGAGQDEYDDEYDGDDAYPRYVLAQAPNYGEDWLVLADNEAISVLLAYRGELAGQVTILLREAYEEGVAPTSKRVDLEAFWRAFFAAARSMSPISSDADLG